MGKRGAKVRLTFFGEQDFSALYGSKQHHIPVAHLALAQINAQGRRRVKKWVGGNPFRFHFLGSINGFFASISPLG